MSGLQVKCYLFPKNSTVSKKSMENVTEIRRFYLESSINGLYQNLLDKIMVYFKDTFSNVNEIKTYYMDDENEFVGFSSNNELQFGIDVNFSLKKSNDKNTSNVFKIYVLKDVGSDLSSSSSDEEEDHSSFSSNQSIHYGVVCDGCDGSIVGNRYKCTICSNYDLCATCESIGIHKSTNHPLMKIQFPDYNHNRSSFYHNGNDAQFGQVYDNFRSSMHKMKNMKHLKSMKKHFKKHFKGPFQPPYNYPYNVHYTQAPTPVPIYPSTMNESSQTSFSNQTNNYVSSSSASAIQPQSSISESAIFQSIPNQNNQQQEQSFNMIDMDKEMVIINAMQQLKEMGFDERDNKLITLVRSKNGNITEVLDSLY